MVIPGVNDAAEFKDTQKALSTVGITIERQWSIFKLLAALLHLGNIKITSTRTEALLADDDPSLVFAAKLLGLEKKIGEFKKWIIKKQIVTRSESIVTGLTAPQAIVVRDSVAKFVYSCLFDWLVAVVNESLYTEGVDDRVKNFIGVLVGIPFLSTCLPTGQSGKLIESRIATWMTTGYLRFRAFQKGTSSSFGFP